MANIPQLIGNDGTDFNEMHNAEVIDTLNEVITKVNAFTGEGTGDERIDAMEATAPSSAQKTWLNSNSDSGKTTMTTTEKSYLPSSAEKTWLGAQSSGVAVTSAQKTWLDGQGSSGKETVSVAEHAILTALQAGGNSFFVALGAPVVADTDRVVESVQWGDGTLTIAAQPDVPRNVTATLTDVDNSVSGLLTVNGTDIAGRVISETMAPDGAGNGKTLTGTKVFKTVTSVVISGTAGAGAGDNLVVGVGNVIGVPVDLANVAEVVSVRLGGVLVGSPTKATGVSTSGIDTSASTYNGSKVLDAIIQMGLT